MTLIFSLFLMGFTWIPQDTLAQGRGQHKSKIVRKLQRTVWTAGISGVVIDDNARPFKDLFDVQNTWNLLPYPTRVMLEGYIDKGFSAEGSFAYMRLSRKRMGDKNDFQPEHVTLLTFDASVKYDLNEAIGNTKALSPYAVGGLGYTHRGLPSRKSAITANIGFGFNIWIYRGVGITAQSMAKFAINKAASKNYLMHTLGLVYRFNLLRGYITPNRLGHRRR